MQTLAKELIEAGLKSLAMGHLLAVAVVLTDAPTMVTIEAEILLKGVEISGLRKLGARFLTQKGTKQGLRGNIPDCICWD